MTPTLNKPQWKCAYAKVPGPGSTCKKHLIHFFSCPLCSRLSWKCLFVHSGVLGGMAQLADSSVGCKGSNAVRTWEWSRVRAKDPTEDSALASCHSSSCYVPQEQGQCTCLLLRASVSTPFPPTHKVLFPLNWIFFFLFPLFWLLQKATNFTDSL